MTKAGACVIREAEHMAGLDSHSGLSRVYIIQKDLSRPQSFSIPFLPFPSSLNDREYQQAQEEWPVYPPHRIRGVLAHRRAHWETSSES